MARERKFSTNELYQNIENLLLQHGYDGFTISILAEKMNISRGALYKYYENKDEMIYDYLLYVMDQFMLELQKIELLDDFQAKFEYLFELFFRHHKIHQIIAITHHVLTDQNELIHTSKQKLNTEHEKMYTILEKIMQQGVKEGMIKPHLPSQVIFGILFRVIDMPKHLDMEYEQWKKNSKEIITNGIFSN